MLKNVAESFSTLIRHSTRNIFFLGICVVALSMPMIATIGQFLHTGFFQKTAPFLLFYWPGSENDIKMLIPVWIGMGLILGSYVAGIVYLLKNRTLGTVIVIVIFVFIGANLIKAFLAGAFGWQESPLPNLAGKANSTIVSLWHNPIWEEIVFRGIPLLILILTEKYITKRRTLTGILLYCIIPSVICGFYHIPGHGIIRFFDTLFIGCAFAWLALEYTFFAPVVMHYIADAMLVLSLNKIPTIQPDEVEWIIQYGRTLNTFFSLSALLLLILLPVFMLFYYFKFRRQAKNN